MATLLQALMLKAPELITDAATCETETSAVSFRDFFVEKIIRNFAHPMFPESMCGHRYNRALVGVETEDGLVLSLKTASHVGAWEDQATPRSSMASADQTIRDQALESIKVVSDNSDVYVDSDGQDQIPVISALTTDAGKHSQDQLGPDLLEVGAAADSGSKQTLCGLGIRNTALIEHISEFMEAEAEACDSANICDDYSNSDGDSEAPAKSVTGGVKQSGFKINPSFLHLFSEGVRNEDPLSPLKMDLFRNLVQHKLVFSARNTTANYYVPLIKSESLFRDIRALDRIHAHETVKIAVLYVGPGQWTEVEILSNLHSDTSGSYRSFVDSLGWPVDLATFQGFVGKLESDGSDGKQCPYFADESTEVVFHEAAAMLNDANDTRQIKKQTINQIVDKHVDRSWLDSIAANKTFF
ncbi:hypothetical protein H4R26_003123 [Coemansia thaxteri]|uniref:Rap-GAP domain-containing protein n=1 Tax=Coemansia thaxteri TaxID=2663907 RepID=A0A9W8BJG4_9FUNG|nr:hypothetical protein H4R26_003123 [Coemansia thaxteri]